MQTSVDCLECKTEHELVLDEEKNRWEIEAVAGEPAWEPMTPDDARAVLEAAPKAGVTDAAGFARLLEAWMVNSGAEPDRIKRALEAFLGRILI